MWPQYPALTESSDTRSCTAGSSHCRAALAVAVLASVSQLRVRSHVAVPQQIFCCGFDAELVVDFCPLTLMGNQKSATKSVTKSALVAADYELWIWLQIFCGFHVENLLQICPNTSLHVGDLLRLVIYFWPFLSVTCRKRYIGVTISYTWMFSFWAELNFHTNTNWCFSDWCWFEGIFANSFLTLLFFFFFKWFWILICTVWF